MRVRTISWMYKVSYKYQVDNLWWRKDNVCYVHILCHFMKQISSLFNVVYNNLLTPFLEDLPKQSLVFNSHLKMDLKYVGGR